MKDIILKNKLIYIALIVCQVVFFVLIIRLNQHINNVFIMLMILMYPITTLILVSFILKCGHQRDIIKKQNEHTLTLQKQRHSFSNHLVTLSSLMNNNELDKANEYLKIIGNVTTNLAKIEGINNHYVASVLNLAILKAEKNKIVFKLNNISDFSNFPLSPTHTVTILSNLIDNAIENCEKEDGFVYIEIKEDEKYFNFTISNNGSPIKLYKKDDSLEKWLDKIQRLNRIKGNERGCGLLIVNDILKQYNDSELIIEDNEPPTFTLKLKIGG